MNRKNLLIIGAIIAAAVIIVTIILSIISAGNSYTLSQPMALNMRYAHQTGSGKVDYFDGTSFMQFDIATQTSKPLSASLTLPNVTDIHWGETAALFKANNYGSADQLTAFLTAKNLSTDGAYWWVIDFKSGNISLIGTPTGTTPGTNVDDAIWSQSNKSYFFLQTASLADSRPTTSLYTATPGAAPTLVAATDATKLIWTDDKQLIYQTDNQDKHSLSKMDIAARTTKTLVDSAFGDIKASSDGTHVLILNTGGSESAALASSGTLQLIDVAAGKVTTVAKSFAGSLAWSDSSNKWVAMGSQKKQLAGYMGDGASYDKLTVGAGKNDGLPDDLQVVGFTGNSIFLIDGQNTAYVAASKLPSLKVVFPPNTNRITYEGTDGLLDIGITEDQLDDFKYALLQYIGTKGNAITSISITQISKVPHDRNSASTTETVNFTVTINDKSTYLAKLEYFDLNAARLTLMEVGGSNAVYTSGVITPQIHN